MYRRIVSHLGNHITQRAIYSGWSKFSITGAIELKIEIDDFITSSAEILASVPIGSELVKKNSEVPWKALVDKIKVLSLPISPEGGEGVKGIPTFSQGMAAGWSDGDESLKGFFDRAGITGMDRGELQSVLRRRNECWR